MNLWKLNYKAGETGAKGSQVWVYPWLHSRSKAHLGHMRSCVKNWSIKKIHGIREDNYVASLGLVLTKYLNILFKKGTQEVKCS